jgi:hypothetical protein
MFRVDAVILLTERLPGGYPFTASESLPVAADSAAGDLGSVSSNAVW